MNDMDQVDQPRNIPAFERLMNGMAGNVRCLMFLARLLVFMAITVLFLRWLKSALIGITKVIGPYVLPGIALSFSPITRPFGLIWIAGWIVLFGSLLVWGYKEDFKKIFKDR